MVCLLDAVPGPKARTALTTVYAAGLRASEATHIKVADIDSGRMAVRIEQGKGGRDRYVMLSPRLLGILQSYPRLARPDRWPGQPWHRRRITKCARGTRPLDLAM